MWELRERNVPTCLVKGADQEQAPLTEAQGKEAPAILNTISEGKQVSLDHMLNDHYGIPWCLSVLELELTQEMENYHTVKEPKQIFSLVMPDNVHPLPQVAEMGLCHVNLEFVKVGVLSILDTGAQRSLLNASSY